MATGVNQISEFLEALIYLKHTAALKWSFTERYGGALIKIDHILFLKRSFVGDIRS